MPRLHRAVACGEIEKVNEFLARTALHRAFEVCVDFNDFQKPSLHTKMIDLLISLGAEPLKDREGKTPLMRFIGTISGGQINPSVISKYCAFEANYYGVSAERYEREIRKLDSTGLYSAIPIQREDSTVFFALVVTTIHQEHRI